MELYERWLDTCAENRGSWAIREEATGKSWTFGELDEVVQRLPRLKKGRQVPVAVEDGAVAFVVKTLQVWRDGAALVPIEKAFECLDDSGEVPEGVIHIKTTSGSTGEPRRVYFEASQLVADCEQIWETMGLERTAPNLAVISMAHSYGFSNLVLPMLLKGMPMIALGDPLPSTLRRALAGTGRVTLPAVPAMWRAWHQAGVLSPANISCAITAGASMPLDLEISIFDCAGLKVHNFYGSSECGGIAYDATNTPRESTEVAGRAMKGVALKIGDDGCLQVQSAAVARCYDADIDSLSWGVFKTTDLARLKDGIVYLDGRLTDTIHVAGRKVSPQVIEAALLRCTGVRHCVVFGVVSSDSTRVEEIVACVNMDEGMSHEALQTEIGKTLPSWQVPRRWWKTSQVLPDERGKLPRALWRERFLGVTVH